MNLALTTLHTLFPFVTLAFLLVGIIKRNNRWIVASLWLSLAALVLHYQTARGEILGSYFDYFQSFLYSINLLVLLVAMAYLLRNLCRETTSRTLRALAGFVIAAFTTGIVLLLINLWMNARFIEQRMPNSPVLQVGSFQPLTYCRYRYVFYTINQDGQLTYLCPNYYGLLPSTGHLPGAPDYLLRQLPAKLRDHFKPPQT